MVRALVALVAATAALVAAAPPSPLRPAPGSALARLAAAHPAHAAEGNSNRVLADLSARHRGKRPPMVMARSQHRNWTSCPAPLAASVNATGLLPVDWFRATFNVSCDQAVRLAMNTSQHSCGGVLFFATSCAFESTVVVPSGVGFQGGAGTSDEFSTPTQAEVRGPAVGPAFLLASVEEVHFSDLVIIGGTTGVYITDTALVRFTNVAIHAQWQGTGHDNVNLTADGCDGCNVVLGSNNTALVVENSFWVWAEDSSFYFYPMYGHGPPPFNNPAAGATWGQRPTVIIRGNHPGRTQGINTVYLLHFDRIVCSGGGFQYQQLVDGEQWPGFYDFNWVSTERAATPWFDVQSAPDVHAFSGVQALTIIDYSGADPTAPHYLKKYPALTAESVGCKDLLGRCVGLVPIVALNCSGAPHCKLSGLTLIAT
jgi:hypothetical protein